MEENKNRTTEVLNTGKIIIEIIKAQLTGGEYSLPVNCDYKKLFKMAEMHKVTSLIAGAVVNDENAPDNVKDIFKKELFKASMRYSAQEKEREELSHIFSDNGIKFCFLKGYKVSRYYPEPELRFMLDMDVFVEESKIAQAEEIVKGRGYVLNTFGDDKDIGYIKKPFLNIEIHKDLKYDYDKGFTYYKGAFERLTQGELPGEMHMTNEDFYVYILSHTAHHFQTSGTGIKNVLDHFILKDKLLPECKANELYTALETVGLTEFSKRMDALSDYWFNGGKCDDDILEMAEYVLLSGVFGNETNNYLSGILRGEYKESRLSYLLHRAFPPFNQMKVRYKILCRFPVLLPIMWIVRLFAFTGSKTTVSSEMNTINSVDDAKKHQFEAFMGKNGL